MQLNLDPSEPLARRAHARYPLSMRVWAASDHRGAWLLVADVGLDGVGCLSERRFPLMSRVTLSLDILEGRCERETKPLEVDAIVFCCAFQNGAWRLGLHLPHHNSLARERYVRFLCSRFIDDQPPPEQDQG